jgi:hypothetical protein
MLDYDTMLGISLVAALVALVRMRTATFIIIANTCIMLRALSSIEVAGQPRSQNYLPSAVFDLSRLQTAQYVFLIVTLISIVAVILPGANKKPVENLPALPKWVLVFVALYFILVSLSQRTIFTVGYATSSQEVFSAPVGGLTTFCHGLVLYELYRRVHSGALTMRMGFTALFVFLFITDYSKGYTGSATGFLFTASFLLLGRERRSWDQVLKLGAVLAVAAFIALVIRHARGTLHTEGADALVTASEQLASSEQTRSEGGEGIDMYTNGSQYAAHTLECVTLYDSGYSRQWKSLYLPLIYTFQPKFIMDMLGWERALDAPWELNRYFVHGGGIAIFGEMYWNGGYPCVALVTALAFLLAYFCDTRRDQSFGWLIFHCMYAPALLQGVGYGLAYLIRGSCNALIVIGIRSIGGRVSPRIVSARNALSAASATVATSPSETGTGTDGSVAPRPAGG